MLIELANKTIIAVRLAILESFSGRYIAGYAAYSLEWSHPPVTIHQSRLSRHGGEINGYKTRRLQVPALRQDFLREERG
jgi:hypothetical protein